MPHGAAKLKRLIRQFERRVTDVEQSRPPDAATQKVENVPEEEVQASDSVSESEITDPTMSFNSGDNFNESEFA